MAPFPVWRISPIIHVSLDERLAQILDTAKVGEIAVRFAGQQDMKRMVEIIVPLRVDPLAANLGRIDYAGVVEIALRDQPGATAQCKRLSMEGVCHLPQEMARAEVKDSVNRIEPERVDVIL